MRLAEILRSKREMNLIASMNGIDNTESRLTLYQYVDNYSSERGRESQAYKVLPYLEKFGGREVLTSAVTSKWFENFQQKMQHDSGIKSAHTQERYCCYIRECLKKTVRDGILPHDPSDGIRHIRTPESKKKYLTAQEVRRLVETPYTRQGTAETLQSEIRRAFLFGCCTGLRISGIIQLEWCHIDREKMQIIKQQQKTKSYVYIPLKKEAWNLINDGAEHSPGTLIFPELAKTKTTTNRYLHGWAEKAGIQKNVTWHTARHTDATLLIEYGADLYTVQRLLGHTKISTTAQYAKVSDKKQRAAVENLPDFGIAPEPLGQKAVHKIHCFIYFVADCVIFFTSQSRSAEQSSCRSQIQRRRYPAPALQCRIFSGWYSNACMWSSRTH